MRTVPNLFLSRIVMGRLVPALCAGWLLAVGPAAGADDRMRIIDRIMQTGPLTCLADLQPQLRAYTIKTKAWHFVHGMRKDLKLNLQWKTGNPDYEKARVVIAAAISDSEEHAGPLDGAANAKAGVRPIFEAMTDEQLRDYGTFFKRPLGRVFWENQIDFQLCSILRSALSADSTDVEKDALQKRFKVELRARILAVPLKERTEYIDRNTWLRPAFYKAWAEHFLFDIDLDTDYARRYKQLMLGNSDALELLAQPYRVLQ
jgi:hypothetical protein